MKPVRRVVTGHDDQGRSIFFMDSGIPDVFGGGGMEDFAAQGSLALAELWATGLPADNSGNKDSRRPGDYALEPSPGQMMLRIAEFPPEPEGIAKPGKGLESHPGFHKTDTVDFIIVLEGEIYSMMETGETLLKAGDVLIQRGTNHAWSNRSGKMCKIAAVMLNAKPL